MVCEDVIMIIYKAIDKSFFQQYDEIPMTVHVKSEYKIEKIINGLGGFLIKEVPVEPYIKDLGKYQIAMEYETHFDISRWQFYMAFDGKQPVGAITLVSKTPGVNMLDGRDDLCVLWDIRVLEEYKHMGIGKRLFELSVEWAKEHDLNQIKIECQNNNVPACKFYHKHGAVLSKVDEYAYYNDKEIQNEIQFIWYLDLSEK
jgi:ribosomal protein S18 acetylase RimI-like enzyme